MPRGKRRPLRDYLIGVALIVLLGYLLFLVADIFRKEEIARETAKEAAREMVELDERYATLERNLDDLGTERGREASYRDQFGVARPGEEVIIVVTPSSEVPQSGLTWWRKLLGWFGL